MINLGKVRPGSTIYIPFETFASSTGAPITLTGLATSDILVYKDGGTTQRASASGFTLLDTDGIDFDGITGIHGFSIDLADNTTADFWASGSKYIVVVSTVTVDSQTMSFIAATFSIGESGSILDTTIATLAGQTSFTLTAGPADDSALVGAVAVIHDAASAVQQCMGVVSVYTGSTKTVTLLADPGIFTIAAKDNISFMPNLALKATVPTRTLDVSVGGEAGVDWANVGTPGSTVNLSATTVKTATDVETDTADIQGRLPAALTGGGNIKADIFAISEDTGAADNLEACLDGTGAAFKVTTFTITAGLDIDNSNSNGHGVTIDGNGTGHGVYVQSGAGATGDALRLLAASTNGSGARIIGAGTGQGIYTQGGLTGNGLYALGGASEGAGAALESQASTQKNAPGLAVSSASNNGMTITAGTTAGRAALTLTGAQSGYGDAIRLFTGGTGVDVRTTAAPFGSVGSTGNDDTHVHLSGLAGADDVWNGYLLRIFDTSAGTYTTTAITDWDNAGDLATVASLGFTPDNTDKYWILQDDTSSILSAILGDTAELQTDWTDGGRLDLLIDAIKAVTDLLTASNSEPTGVPAADATPLTKLAWIFRLLRNRVDVTASKKTFYTDSNTADCEKDLSDDTTTYSESEINAT